jgi:predicted permease
MAEAADTFGRLWVEAWGSGWSAGAAFVLREMRSLLVAAREERQARAREAQAGRGALAHRAGGAPVGPGRGGPVAGLSDYLRWDVRLALRNLFRAPGFVAVSLLSLTFGIGGSTVLFTVADAMLLRPPPLVAEPEALVRIVTTSRRGSQGPSSYPDFEDYRGLMGSLDDLAAFRRSRPAANTTSSEARLLDGLEVSENYFDVLGIPMARGRGFLPEDVTAGGNVAVLGYGLWERDYGGDPGVVGRTLRLDGRPFTIVGVAPWGMTGLEDPRLLDVVVLTMEGRYERRNFSQRVVGRLEEGATLDRVQAELDGVTRRLRAEQPATWDPVGGDSRGLRALPESQARIPEGIPLPLLVGGFLSVVALLLAIACSNVANLLLSRAMRRGQEMAVRSAIGASRRRIVVQLLTENLLLFGAAGVLALGLARLLARSVASGWPALSLPGMNLAVDARVIGVTAALSLLTGLTFGLLPAVHASRTDLASALKGADPGGRIRGFSLRGLLVGSQAAGSLVLVMLTILLIQGLDHARSVDLGLDPRHVAVLGVDLAHGGYDEQAGLALLSQFMGRAARFPGVQGVALGTWIPLQGGGTFHGGLEPEGYEAGPLENVDAAFAAVTPGYLAVVGMRLLRGRDFGAMDDAGGSPVALVNQAFVDRYWPGESGVGKHIGTRGSQRSVEVVGVVATSKYQAVNEPALPQFWCPFAQAYLGDVIVHVRTAGDPGDLLPQLREQLRELDPDLPILRLDRMESVTANATAPQRVLSRVLGGAALLSVALAMLGIYGVIGYSLSQRTREVGLRVALGAHPRSVVAMVVGEGVRLAMIGLVVGLAVGAGAASVARSAFLGISPLSPVALLGSAGLLLLAAAGASLAPALRAARTDPVENLRSE